MSDNPADAAGIFPSWGCAGMLWLASFTAAGAALICFAAVWLPELIPATAIGCIAWWVWHTFRISGAGTVLTVGAMLSATMIASVSYRSHGSMFDVIPITFSVFVGVPFLLAGVIIFLVRAFASAQERRRNLVAAVSALLLPVGWLVGGSIGGLALNEWHLQREIARSELPDLIAEISALAERQGRVPRDEDELVQLLDRPLPSISRGPIWYDPSGDEHFTLEFGYGMAIYRFDSRQPERGWHYRSPGVHGLAPNAAQPE